MPLEPKIREVAAEFQPGREDFLTALAEFLTRKYRVSPCARRTGRRRACPRTCSRAWKSSIAATRRWPQAAISRRSRRRWRAAMSAPARGKRPRGSGNGEAWRRGRSAICRSPSSSRNVGGAPLLAYPGLELRDSAVNVRLFRKREDAERASVAGVRRLAELAIARDLAWLWKELAGLARHIPVPGRQANNFHDALQQMSVKLQHSGRPVHHRRHPPKNRIRASARSRPHARAHLSAHRRAFPSPHGISASRTARADAPARRLGAPAPRAPAGRARAARSATPGLSRTSRA